ncbi:MAG: hypothetical protein ACOCUN_00900 [Jiangellaceae bacterium]
MPGGYSEPGVPRQLTDAQPASAGGVQPFDQGLLPLHPPQREVPIPGSGSEPGGPVHEGSF